MSDYSLFEWKLPDAGLNIQYPQDLIPLGQWLRLTNIKSTFEGFIETRPGTRIILQPSVNPVHTISRLSEAVLSGSGTGLFRDATPYTDVFNDPQLFSGNPLGIVPYRPEESANPWAYVGSDDVMLKVQGDGTVAKWGISPPSVAATATSVGAVGTGNLDSICAGTGGCTSYEWFYTYGNSKLKKHESDPSPIMQAAVSLNKQAASVGVTASTDPQVDTIYLYRKGGSVKNEFRVKTAANQTQQIEDNTIDADAVLGEQLFRDNAVPFTVSIPGGIGGNEGTVEAATPFVWGPFLGSVILACGVPSHEGFVYWTNPGIPDSSDPDNLVEVTGANEFLVNGIIYNGQAFVFSSEELYALEYGTTDLGVVLGTKLQLTPRKTLVGEGLASPWALCAGPKLWFLSKNGIEETDANGPANSITDEFMRPIFQGRDSGEYKAVDFTSFIKLSYSQNEVNFHYSDTAGVRQHLIYNIIQKRWRKADSPGMNRQLMVEDESQVPIRQLVGSTDGLILLNDPSLSTDETAPLVTQGVSVDIQTGYVDYGAPSRMKEFGGIILDLDNPASAVTVTPFLDAGISSLTPVVQASAGTSSYGTRRKVIVPVDDVYAYSLSLRFQWTGAVRIYGVGVLWRMDEEEIQHWEYPETSFGLPGLVQMEYGYIALRSTADVTMTVESVDSIGTRFVDIYTLPSTASKKRRVPVFFEPRKFTLARPKLDSTAKFRLYGKDCELYVKPWNTTKGYTRVNPFVGTEPSSG